MLLGALVPSLILPLTYANPATGTTVAPVLKDRIILLDNALIAGLTIALAGPTTAIDGQVHTFYCNGGVTTLTVTGVGWGGVFGMPTTLAANGFFSVVCSFTKSGWVRIG